MKTGNSEKELENRNKRVGTKPMRPQKLSLRNAAVSQTMYGPWDAKIRQTVGRLGYMARETPHSTPHTADCPCIGKVC